MAVKNGTVLRGICLSDIFSKHAAISYGYTGRKYNI